MRLFPFLIVCIVLTGCATATTVGSKGWYIEHMEELREARYSGKISTDQYLEFKTEADKIRQEYENESRRYYVTRGYFCSSGCRYHRVGHGHLGCH